MTTQLVSIQFNNQELTATLVNEIPHVAIKQICENLGVDWEGQRQKIERHPVLKSTTCMIKAVAQDGKLREMLMLPIKFLNGWLFGIDANRVRPQAKDAVIKYQTECFEVLANHFMPKVQAKPKTLNTAMLRHITKQINWLVKNQCGTTYASLGGMLLDKFNVNERKAIPFEKYGEVCALLGCEPDVKALQGELVETPKLAYQPPAGMVLIAESELADLKKNPTSTWNNHATMLLTSHKDALYTVQFHKGVSVIMEQPENVMIGTPENIIRDLKAHGYIVVKNEKHALETIAKIANAEFVA